VLKIDFFHLKYSYCCPNFQLLGWCCTSDSTHQPPFRQLCPCIYDFPRTNI